LEKSESIIELSKALIQMQASLKPAVKEKTNPFLKTRYVDLSGVWDVCRALLHENKLAIVQLGGVDANGPFLETVLTHESGEWISGKYPLKPVKPDDPQALGSAMTYARRYTLAAILGIITEDDDAEGAMGRLSESKSKSESKPQVGKSPLPARNLATREQLDKLDVFQKGGKNIKNKVESYKWKINKLSDLSFEQAAKLIQDFNSEVVK
jgi:hypothetical protein